MKKFLLSTAALVAAFMATPGTAQASVEGAICSTGGCVPVDPVTAGVIIVGSTAFNVERACTKDRKRSCTQEAEKAGQNAIDYIRFKKNPAKALERRLKKIFRW